jgi:hypothetical protein
MTPIPLRTPVIYEGERYFIQAHLVPQKPHPSVSDERMATVYPDGVAYVIWPEGVLEKFGNRMYSRINVGRRSLEVAE